MGSSEHIEGPFARQRRQTKTNPVPWREIFDVLALTIIFIAIVWLPMMLLVWEFDKIFPTKWIENIIQHYGN